jgi:hypothetical protein
LAGRDLIPIPYLAVYFFATSGSRRTASILSAALELDVFSAIGKGRRTAAEVATAAGSQMRGIERLLDTLTALKYLKKIDGRYGLEPIAATYLVRESPLYMESLSE